MRMDLVCFELYSPTGKTMITYYVKLPKQEAQVVLDRGLPPKKTVIYFKAPLMRFRKKDKEAINIKYYQQFDKRSNMSTLVKQHCVPCDSRVAALTIEEAKTMLLEVLRWELNQNKIYRIFSFKNFYQTITFANAVAWIANQENHHPLL